MSKVIIIHLTPLVERLKRSFLIESYIKAGYDFEYWDISEIYRGKIPFPDEMNENFISKIDTVELLEKKIQAQQMTKTVFIIPFTFYTDSEELFSILKRYHCYLIRIYIYPRTIQEYIINKYTWHYFLSFSFIMLAIKKLKESFNVLMSKTRTVSLFDRHFAVSPPRTDAINSPDYETYLQIRSNTTRLIDGNYIVFLDDYFGLHAETLARKDGSDRLAPIYQKKMSVFFSKIEKKFGIPVVIAAHPSSEYKGEEFDDRTIIKGKTAQLVKDCNFVITQISTSHTFAVLFDKPIVFTKTKETVMRPQRKVKLAVLASYFGRKPYSVEDVDVSRIDYSKIDPLLREKYIYGQLTSKEIENLTNEEIVLGELEKIFKLLEQRERKLE